MRRFLFATLALALVALGHATPAQWAATIDKFTAADLAHPPPTDAVLFIGSSSIVKWTTLAADFPGVAVINRGFGGSELADSVYYADRIAIPYRPRIVVLYAGDNDIANGKPPETVLAEFRAFYAEVHAALPHTRIVYLAIKPSPSRWKIHEAMQRANALVAAECARDEECRFVDVWTPMLDHDGQPRAELFVSDRLHMNAAGYAIWTPLVAAQLK